MKRGTDEDRCKLREKPPKARMEWWDGTTKVLTLNMGGGDW